MAAYKLFRDIIESASFAVSLLMIATSEQRNRLVPLLRSGDHEELVSHVVATRSAKRAQKPWLNAFSGLSQLTVRKVP